MKIEDLKQYKELLIKNESNKEIKYKTYLYKYKNKDGYYVVTKEGRFIESEKGNIRFLIGNSNSSVFVNLEEAKEEIPESLYDIIKEQDLYSGKKARKSMYGIDIIYNLGLLNK